MYPDHPRHPIVPERNSAPSTHQGDEFRRFAWLLRLPGLKLAYQNIRALLVGRPHRVNLLLDLRDTAIIVPLAIVAILPASLRFIWLAPPHLRSSLCCYDGLALIWIPALLYLIGRRPHDTHGCWVGLEIVAIAVLAAFASCRTFAAVSKTWPGPPVESTYGSPLFDDSSMAVFFALHVSDVRCEQGDISEDRIRYTCDPRKCVLAGHGYLIFEGRRGSPFVRLVTVKLSGGGCD
jgi:hypothetical protein